MRALRSALLLVLGVASFASAHPRRYFRVHPQARPPVGFAIALPHLAFGLAIGRAPQPPVLVADVDEEELPPLVEAEVEPLPPPPPLVQVEVVQPAPLPALPPAPLVQVEVTPPPRPAPAPARVVVAAPVVAPAPVVVARPPPPQVRAEPEPREEVDPDRTPRVAVKWAPFARSVMDLDRLTSELSLNAGSVGLEYRMGRYLALRTDVQYSRDGALWDIAALKLSVFPNSFVRPFISGGLSGIRLVELGSGTRVDSTRLGVVAGAGLNLFFGKHVFLEAEAKFRHYSDDPFNDMAVRNLSQWTALIGAGVAFL